MSRSRAKSLGIILSSISCVYLQAVRAVGGYSRRPRPAGWSINRVALRDRRAGAPEHADGRDRTDDKKRLSLCGAMACDVVRL